MSEKTINSLFRERGVLFACIGIALVLWVFQKLSKTYESYREVRLEYRLPAGQAFNSPPPSLLRAQVSGQGWDLLAQAFQRKNPIIRLDLNNYRRPEVEREELRRLVGEALKMQVNELNISRLEFSIGNIATRKVPVLLDKDISYAPDFFLRDSIRVSPDSVTLSGTPEALGQVAGVVTQPLRLQQLRASQQFRLLLLPPAGGKVALSEDSVNVALDIEQFTEKTFFTPVLVRTSGDSIRVTPSFVQLTCVVSVEHLEKISEEDFVLEADLSQIAQQTARLTVPLNLTKSPVWAHSVDFSPKAVEFFIVE